MYSTRISFIITPTIMFFVLASSPPLTLKIRMIVDSFIVNSVELVIHFELH